VTASGVTVSGVTTRLAALVVAVVFVAIAGCGGDGDSAFPCDLLETSEIEAALGEPVADGSDSETGGIQFCSWEIEDGSGRVRIGVLAVTDIDALMDMATNTEEIDDLGDRAQVGPAGNVAVAVDSRIFQFDVLDTDLPAEEVAEIDEELARTAIPRV
jgi:hypothetical protein